MNALLRSAHELRVRLIKPAKAISEGEIAPDPRAVRYQATAARYHSAAAGLGFRSLDEAIRAGAMPNILRQAAGDNVSHS